MPVYSIIKKSELEGALRIDAEYYQPEYLDITKKLRNNKFFRKFSEITNGGNYGVLPDSVDYIADDSSEEFIYLIRGIDMRGLCINEDDLIKVPKKYFNPKAGTREGDLLFLVKGATIDSEDSVAITPKLPNIAIFNGSVYRSKLKSNILPEYAYLFMRTKYFYEQKRRMVSNIGIEYNSQSEIKNYDFFVPPIDFQTEIKQNVRETFRLLDESKSFYSQAEQMLLKELELEGFEVENDLVSIVKFSEVKRVGRIDAEYFQPKYEKIISRIKQTKHSLLGDLVSIKKGIEIGAEQYQENGKVFIRVSSLSKQGIIDKDQKYLSDELYQKLKVNFEPKIGEILLTKDATPGIAYVLQEKIEGIISSGVLRLKLKQEIEAGYLTLFINSILGQMQSERDAGGSIIAHWKPEQIKSLVVPILPKQTQQQIAKLVQKVHQFRQKAKELLEQAKQKVESSIEES